MHPSMRVHLTAGEQLQLSELIEAASGLRFDRHNTGMLERAVQKRMHTLRCSSSRAYLDLLRTPAGQPDELHRLLPLLTIGETSFYRYPGHFAALRDNVLAEATRRARQGGDPRIRLLSAGCATGEEPYSLAIALMEGLPDWRQRDIRVIGADLDDRSLKKAREGVYRQRPLRNLDPEMVRRYFTRKEDLFTIRDEVKELVEFRRVNLHGDDPWLLLADTAQFDAIFCRNVLIYFTPAAARRAVDRLAGILRPGGYLFLGHAEMITGFSSRFTVMSDQGSFFYRLRDESPARKGLVAPPAAPPCPAMPTTPIEPAIEEAGPSPETTQFYQQARQFFASGDFTEASRSLKAILDKEPEHAGARCLRGLLLFGAGRAPEARRECERALALDDLLPEAYYLSGLLCELEAREIEAVAEYRKALLLDMDFVMPHYTLGLLFMRLGRETKGRRELRNALNSLAVIPAGTMVPFSGGLVRETLETLARLRLDTVGQR